MTAIECHFATTTWKRKVRDDTAGAPVPFNYIECDHSEDKTIAEFERRDTEINRRAKKWHKE